MAKINPSNELKRTIDKAVLISDSPERIKEHIEEIKNEEDKMYAARYLDHQIVKNQKRILHLISGLELKSQKRSPIYSESLGVVFNLIREPLERQEGLPVVSEGPTISSDPIREEIQELKHYNNNARLARQNIPYSKEQLYCSLESLYEKQLKSRPWYKHGVFALAMGILLSPLFLIPPPIIYYLWKKDRDEEVIQLNELSSAEQEKVKTNRKAFKWVYNLLQVNPNKHFLTKKPKQAEEEKVEQEVVIPKYFTLHKKQRCQFFIKHEFKFVDRSSYEEAELGFIRQEAEKIQASKEADAELSLILG